MSDSSSVVETADVEATTDSAESTTTEPTIESLQAEVEKWKNFSRSNEKRAKENLSAAQELEALKEAEKTELEKLAERAERAEAELSTTRLEAVKNRIAVKHGLTDEDVTLFLTATDEEQIEAQAQALASRIKASKPSKVSVDNSDLEGVSSADPNQALAKQMFKF